ncbi:MAG: DUF4062 domain-containing protein, partial [Ktedonobacterales bacterium]|nr:DUF4062 domain-containing protein [Ktedonobacterales bacterium]
MALPPLRVFLSSSVYGLQPFRAMVEETLLSLQQLPVGMEHFYAQPGGAIAFSTESVAECDIYVGIIAWRYGTIKPGETRSITHLEYDEAVALGKPRYLYLANESTRQDLALFPTETRDPEHETKLLDWRTFLQQNEVVSYFDSAAELGRQVSIGISRELQKRFAVNQPSSAVVPPLVLPPQTPDFVGRETELKRLYDRLSQGHSVSLSAVVVGMGGIGKSTLAAEVLHRFAEAPQTFPGGIAFVGCDQKTGMEGLATIYEQILTLWQRPLSADEATRASTPEQSAELRETLLRSHLARVGKSLLLLDNVEHELPLDRLVTTLMGVGMTVVVTSRYVPTSPRLQVERLDVLAPEAARALFRDRYTERGGHWLAERDAVATLEVVAHLGHLPLAIELAAARGALRPLSPNDLAQELREPGVLAKLQDASDPTASVRYALEQSLATLSEGERQQFAALNLLRGADAPRIVAQAVLAAVGGPGSDGSVVLDRLAAFSLVEVFAVDREASGPYPQRMRFHPLLRELAQERWQAVPEATKSISLEALLTALADVVGGYGQDIIREVREESLIADAIRQAAQQR